MKIRLITIFITILNSVFFSYRDSQFCVVVQACELRSFRIHSAVSD